MKCSLRLFGIPVFDSLLLCIPFGYQPNLVPDTHLFTRNFSCEPYYLVEGWAKAPSLTPAWKEGISEASPMPQKEDFTRTYAAKTTYLIAHHLIE